MREKGQKPGCILSCQRSLRLKWGCTKDLCYHLFFFAVVVDIVSELDRDGVLSELLYTDGLLLMSETIGGLRNKFLK